MSLREEQCKKVCRILDNVLANRPTERDSLIVAVRKAFAEPETGEWIETEGLDEEIRCLMCTNHMRSSRGCDGACQYDEHVYKEIMSALKRRMMEVEQ